MRLGMQIAFGCVHRKTASTGLGYLGHNSFLKLTLMGTPQNRTIGVNLGVFVAFVSTHAALTGLRRRRRRISINMLKKHPSK